jgi:tRNA dimethylallyltransferase
LIVILGPTVVGKSEFAISLAERLNGEIISADSRLFYRGMDIGAAQPTPQWKKMLPLTLRLWAIIRTRTIDKSRQAG